MLKLLDGIAAFHAGLTPASQERFAQLALGQSPDAAFIGCSDSRVDPRIFASNEPGDVFVTRNVGNLIPPNGAPTASPESASTLAVIEYALLQLKVRHIIVCGHSECGAMLALLNDTQIQDAPHLQAWLEHGRKSLERWKAGAILDEELLPHNQLSQINILQQIDHLKRHPIVNKRLISGALQLHGWWFEIATASVYAFNEDHGRFSIIDAHHACKIYERAAAIETEVSARKIA
jgi:carbonic anhydrase